MPAKYRRERTLGRELERLCREADSSAKKDAPEFDEEVTFPDGRRVAIQVVGPLDPAREPCWTQGVLFGKDGTELDCTDVGDSFEGEYYLSHGDTAYLVEVVITPTG